MRTSIQAMTIVLIVTFLAYFASILRTFLKRSPQTPGDASEFEFHLFVPCRDEEAVIDQTLAAMRADFPDAHVWVIDDDSDDATAQIVEAWVARDPSVHLVRRRRPFARTGKGDALNSAYLALDHFLRRRSRPRPTPGLRKRVNRAGVVVGVVDADSSLASDALSHISTRTVFGDPRVGGAQIAVWMSNRDERRPRKDLGRAGNAFARYLTRMQDIEFRTVIAAMQTLRVRTGSVGLGGNGQFTRLSVLDEIASMAGQPWHGALLEDYELGLHVLLAGYDNRYVDDTHVSQEAVTDLRRLLTQRTRWAQGNMQCAKYLSQIVRSRYFGSAAVLEAAYYLLLPYLQVVGAIVWPTAFAFTITSTLGVTGGPAAWLHATWTIWVLVVVLGIGPFAMWGPLYRARCERQVSRSRAVVWGLGMWLYTYYVYFCATRAFARVLLRRSGWAKTRRNAENLSIGVIASQA